MFKYRVTIKEDNLILDEEIVSLKYSFDPVDDNLSVGDDVLNMEMVIKILNKDHFKYFINWIEDKTNRTYRNIKLEYIFNEENKMTLEFKEMFIDFLNQKFSLDNDLGNYCIRFKQKYFLESKRIILGDD